MRSGSRGRAEGVGRGEGEDQNAEDGGKDEDAPRP